MNIKLNGKEHTLDKQVKLSELLEELDFADKPVVVEHNKEALFPRDYKNITIAEGDSLEIIVLAAGG